MSASVPLFSPSLEPLIAQDRALVDHALERALAADQGRIGRTSAHLVRAGGKRARPLLSCALIRALGGEPGRHSGALISSELIHTASLLHDDLVDSADTRRALPATHLAFDAKSAIMAGDLLMAEALRILAREAGLELVAAAAEAVAAMSRGQVMEAEQRKDLSVGAGQVLSVNRLKTASLIAFAAEAGARLGGASEVQVCGAIRFGLRLGEAFQLVDDLLDWTGLPAMTGKPAGQDLRQGRVTYPLHLALAREPALACTVEQLWAAPEQDPDGPARVLATLRRTGALDETRALAAEQVSQALDGLATLPASPWTEHLAAYAHGSLTRAA